MDLIILNDGLYHLMPVTKEILGDVKLFNEIGCFDLCNIVRKKISLHDFQINMHVIKDGIFFFGCICK